MPARKPSSQVDAQRAALFKLMWANPISGLTPRRLVGYLNAYARGDIRQAALLWQQILERDDQIGPCATKRTRGVSRLKWQILPIDDSPEAQKHKEALEYFYNNLTAYDGLNKMKRGGVRQLIKQMMTAVGMEYAVHEIIYRPNGPGELTADFKFLPLQFFENRTGELRFLQNDNDQIGAPLDEFFGDGNWLVNAGDGLMVASSVAYILKTPSGLKAWVNFVEKYGIPGLHAKTTAAKGSAEWESLVEALAGFGEDLALVTNEGASIAPIEIKNAGANPHQSLVDRMDRAVSRIWMGGDLATMSKDGAAVGSQPQGDDLDTLKEDDAESITDALNESVDTQVIQQLFGDVSPLAYFQLVVPKKKTTDDSVKRLEFLVSRGVRVGTAFARQELNVPEPAEDEETLTQPAPAATPDFRPPSAVNDAAAAQRQAVFRTQAKATLSRAQGDALQPLTQRLEQILGMEDETAQDAALIKLQQDMPGMLQQISADPQLVAAWEKILGTALASGAAEGAQKQDTLKQ